MSFRFLSDLRKALPSGKYISKDLGKNFTGWRTVEDDAFNYRTATDAKCLQSEIVKDNDEDMNKFLQALKTIKRFKIEHLEQLLPEHNTAKATTGLYGQERDAKWAEIRNWQEKYEILEKSHKHLQQKFDETDSEMKAMKDKNKMMDKESKSYQAQLQEKERNLQEHERGRHWQVEYENLEKRYKDLQRNFDQHQMMVADKIKIENEHEMRKSMFNSTEQELLKEKSEKSQLLKLVKKLDKESKSYQAQLQEKEWKLQEQREATKKAYAEKDDALTRLSRHMGQQMSEGNPNITDLSDPNRPSKLGERFSELYDNEWTNAFECLTTETFHMNDKDAIDVLRKILLESYKSAFDISCSQMEEAEYKLSGTSKAVSPECRRLLKEARKHIDIKQADNLIKSALERTIMKGIERKYLNETLVQLFAKECFQLCWLMSIQDPPVVLNKDPIQGSCFDTSMYKHYVNSGDTIDYVVWPALLLHKDGPLLTKGVAQPVPKLRPKSAFPLGENKKTDNGTVDKFSQSLCIGKVQEIPSPADRRNPSQWDSSSRKKLDIDPIETQTNSSQRGMAQTQRHTTNAMQFSKNSSFVNDQDAENFQRFCHLYPTVDEWTMKQWFDSDFERFYNLYIIQKFGNHSTT